mgnify:CR=1 FL=1
MRKREGEEGKVLENRRLSREGGLGGTVGAPSKIDWVMVGRQIRKYEYEFEKLWLFHQKGI